MASTFVFLHVWYLMITMIGVVLSVMVRPMVADLTMLHVLEKGNQIVFIGSISWVRYRRDRNLSTYI